MNANKKRTTSRRALIARIAIGIMTVGAFASIGTVEHDPVRRFLEIMLTILIWAVVEVILNALRVDEMGKSLEELDSAYTAIKKRLLQPDTILPEIKSELEEISQAYKDAKEEHLPLFNTLASGELNELKARIVSLGTGHYQLRRQHPHIVHSSWAPMVELAKKGDLIIATSDVTPAWWENNKQWVEVNEKLVNSGVGIIRIFFARSQDDYEHLKEAMTMQAKIGVQINIALVDEVNKVGRKTRDMMLIKPTIAELGNPLNTGKRVQGGIALGEQHLLNDRTDWESLTMADDPRLIQEACDDLSAYLRVSKRLEDDSWAADFFDRDLHQIMASKDPDTVNETAGVSALLECTKGGKYLDLGTGYGRLAIPLAISNPITVVAVEQSRELLDELEREFDRQVHEASLRGIKVKGNIVPKHCDIRKLLSESDLVPGSFDGAFNIFDSFGYYQSEDENKEVLRVTAELLKPGGTLVLDLINPKQVHHRARQHDWGRGVVSWAFWDEKRKRLLESYIIKNSVFKFKPLVSLRIYELNEIRDILANVGYDCSPGILARYGSLSLSPPAYDDHSSRLIVVAHKKISGSVSFNLQKHNP